MKGSPCCALARRTISLFQGWENGKALLSGQHFLCRIPAERPIPLRQVTLRSVRRNTAASAAPVAPPTQSRPPAQRRAALLASGRKDGTDDERKASRRLRHSYEGMKHLLSFLRSP